jgi:formylglycine-generating enzyme required for sulfatase activity
MIRFIATDLNAIEKRDKRSLRHIRYFTITHLYNAGYSDNELQTYRLAISKLVNSLSWGRKIKIPQAIDPAKTILRIDLRHYEWDIGDKWNQILARHPYSVTYDDATAKSCYQRTRTTLPYVRGDWFVARASLPPLYHELLDIPKTDTELERRLQINVARNLANDQAARAAFNGSGVSTNNRLIERHVSNLTGGAYWKSYDFKALVERSPNGSRRSFPERNLFGRPLGPKSVMPTVRKPFVHAGGENIWNLPNGLQAYMLVDEKGKRIDKGPNDIVTDPNTADRLVVNGLSCMSCHTRGMKNKTDQVRASVLANRGAYTEKEIELVQALFPEPNKFQRLLDEDAKRFADAVKLTGGKVSDTDPIVVLAQRFDGEVDLPLAAAEFGLEQDELTKLLGALARRTTTAPLSRVLSPLRVAGLTVKRDEIDRVFGEIIKAGELGVFLQPVKVIENSIGMKLVRVPAGDFQMGSPKSEEDRNDTEGPVHRVKITKPFYLGVHEVTQGEFEKVMGTSPWKGKPNVKEGSDYAATRISWDDAVEFCKKLSAKEGRTYRLPTEAEWEYACRAGCQTAYSFGADSSKLGVYAWCSDNAWKIGEDYAHVVGQKRANAFGLYDMHGNVYEWCADRFDKSYYGNSPTDDPTGPTKGDRRMHRGGSWIAVASAHRSAFRGYYSPDTRYSNLGFRVALVLSE